MCMHALRKVSGVKLYWKVKLKGDSNCISTKSSTASYEHLLLTCLFKELPLEKRSSAKGCGSPLFSPETSPLISVRSWLNSGVGSWFSQSQWQNAHYLKWKCAFNCKGAVVLICKTRNVELFNSISAYVHLRYFMCVLFCLELVCYMLVDSKTLDLHRCIIYSLSKIFVNWEKLAVRS